MSLLNSQKNPFILRLQRNKFINSAIKVLRVNILADIYLNFFPISKSLPSGIIYKIRSTSSLIASGEVFNSFVYKNFIQTIEINSFIDLGCNVGYFPLLVSDMKLQKSFRGLMVDGNYDVLTEAINHLRINNIEGVKTLHGIVGFASEIIESDFFICKSSHIASSATGHFNPTVVSAGQIQRQKVKCINVYEEWVRQFNNNQVDIMKVDIEGMELEFFINSAPLLANCKNIIFEWHKWQVSFVDCCAILVKSGFTDPTVICEDEQHGVAFCKRKN